MSRRLWWRRGILETPTVPVGCGGRARGGENACSAWPVADGCPSSASDAWTTQCGAKQLHVCSTGGSRPNACSANCCSDRCQPRPELLRCDGSRRCRQRRTSCATRGRIQRRQGPHGAADADAAPPTAASARFARSARSAFAPGREWWQLAVPDHAAPADADERGISPVRSPRTATSSASDRTVAGRRLAQTPGRDAASTSRLTRSSRPHGPKLGGPACCGLFASCRGGARSGPL